MNYDRLKELLRNNKYSIAKAAHAIGRTEGWFHKTTKMESMTISDLEKLLKLCKTNLYEYFGGQPSNVVNELQAEYGKDIKELELLREIHELRIRIDDLEAKKKP